MTYSKYLTVLLSGSDCLSWSDYMITVDSNSLTWLLTLSQRKQNVSGKVSPQVHSLMMRAVGSRLTACSLVKDGLSSLTLLSIPCSGTGNFAISDIDAFLGALKYHGGVIRLEIGEDKIILKSSNKQTTMTSSDKALAFPHTSSNVNEWEAKSVRLATKLNLQDITYQLNSGGKRKPFASWLEIDTTTLYEAFRCDNMNNQRYNLYTITSDERGLCVEVGKNLKGKTISQIDPQPQTVFEAVFMGGLEYVFKELTGTASVHFFDFRPEGQGIRMLITLGDGDFIFQASNLG